MPFNTFAPYDILTAVPHVAAGDVAVVVVDATHNPQPVLVDFGVGKVR